MSHIIKKRFKMHIPTLEGTKKLHCFEEGKFTDVFGKMVPKVVLDAKGKILRQEDVSETDVSYADVKALIAKGYIEVAAKAPKKVEEVK
jgi:hypothetical protein